MSPHIIGPYRPHEQHEGPATSCYVGGKPVGWMNCSCTSCAMGIDQATLGAQRPDDCTIRSRIRDDHGNVDNVGGTTLNQVARVASYYGVTYELHVGGNVASPGYLAGQLRLGRGFEGQGDAAALLGTPYRSTAGAVAHCVHFNEGEGWHLVNGTWLPRSVLVFDPAADSRKAGWGTAANAPQWWPWATALKFFAMLRPSGPGTPMLGSGAVYSAILPMPKVHLRTGAKQTGVHPMVAHPPVAGRKVNVRSGPSTKFPIVEMLAAGDVFVRYQHDPNGQTLSRSRDWIGSQDGTMWAHSSGLR